MKLGRRSFMAFLGLGGAAAPVALPAFGKAVAMQQGGMAGLGYSIDRLGGENSSSMPDPAYDSVADVARRKLFNKTAKEVIDAALETNYQEARERSHNLRMHVDDMYNLPSWSPAFRKYIARQELLKREEETKTWGERVQEATLKFWKDNGGTEEYFNGPKLRSIGSGENAARSRG